MTQTIDFTSHINGVSLACQWVLPDEAKADGPCWVFMHEALGSISIWKDFPKQLCERTGLRGFVYDRRGHGKSDPHDHYLRPADYHEIEARDYLRPLLQAVGIDQPLMFSHSDGATIALKYAALFPEEPLGILVEAPHTWREDITLDGILEAKKLFETTNIEQRLRKHHGDKTHDLYLAWVETWTQPYFDSWDMRDDLEKIICRSVAIQGIDDHFGSEEQLDVIVERSTGPSWKLMLPNCAHIPHFEATDMVLDASVEFLREII